MIKFLPLLLNIAFLISMFIIKRQKDDKDEMLKSLITLEVSLNKSNENLDEKNIILLKDLAQKTKN